MALAFARRGIEVAVAPDAKPTKNGKNGAKAVKGGTTPESEAATNGKGTVRKGRVKAKA